MKTNTLENGQAKHTPGPWTIGDQIKENKYGVLERSINSEEIDEPVINLATVYGNDESAEANARLIAAAPELLEALETVDRWMRGYGTKNQGEIHREYVLSAIKKAKG